MLDKINFKSHKKHLKADDEAIESYIFRNEVLK